MHLLDLICKSLLTPLIYVGHGTTETGNVCLLYTSDVYKRQERGERIPVVPKLLKLCDIFNVSTDYLLGRKSSNHISLEGLSPNDAKAVATIIKSLREKNIKN